MNYPTLVVWAPLINRIIKTVEYDRFTNYVVQDLEYIHHFYIAKKTEIFEAVKLQQNNV